MNELNLKGGVLIIGSLLWQDHLEQERDDIRKNWRNNNLILDNKIMVKVPIRYGRSSQSKNNPQSTITTMIFSNSCKKNNLGTGYFVPFKKNLLATFKDLMEEANALSVAEGMRGKLLKGNPIWCSISLLFNPNTVEEEKKVAIEKKWRGELAKEGVLNPDDFKVKREKACIDKDGILNIDWFKPVDVREMKTLNEYDIVIATATVPKPKKYPSIDELVGNVRTETERYYFIKNYIAGITTFQDIKVLNKL
jgi:hypothetical protein